ncbi:MAG: hypothetical protein ACYC56_12520 [Candidatus Aquicultor sp.]
MTPHQENKLVMYGAVIAFEKRFTEIIGAIPALAAAFGKFTEAVGLIKSKSKKKEEVVAGKIEAREKAKIALVTSLVPATGALHSYARKNSLEEMKKLTYKVTRASLNKLNQTEFEQKVGILYNLLETNKTSLGDYGTPAAKVDAVKVNIDAYNGAKEAHKGSGNEKSSANTAMDEAFATADDILKGDIDRMMEIPREANPEMYNEYISARVIKDMSGGHRPDEGENPPPDEPTPPAQ